MEHIEIIEEMPFLPDLIQPVQQVSNSKPFIEANTIPVSIFEMKKRHIIPVFVKDNETLISHDEFIDAASVIAADVFHGEQILRPSIRVSHPIKGRTPDAKDKPASHLEEWEKTLYYERMAFVIEVPSITDTIGGNTLSLTIGGVKSYSLDNLYNKKGSDEHFKLFIGFKNKVCTNLCIWTDGFKSDIRVQNLGQLQASIRELLESYNQSQHLHHLNRLTDYSITESQFAHLIGRLRMYPHLPADQKRDICPLLLGDTQIGAVVKDFYKDESFCRDNNGNINLWKLYNLFTGTNKTSYIDTFLDRSVNAYDFTDQIRHTLENRRTTWYLN